ncbi:MAG: kinetochore-associated Ndc80 complex subunit spc24 [Watsoniomyces obsoletus]|nr:MAG: kinetochore-associated Ndc80 complex subunit spc24 [Watsoniomyces obsoletus]
MADNTRNPTGDEVYCHECRSVWPRIEHGLTCPHCGSEFTEIVESDNDPRTEQINDADMASWTTGIPGFPDPSSDRPGSSSNPMNGIPTPPGMPEGQFTQRTGRFGPIQYTSVVYRSGTPQAGPVSASTSRRSTTTTRTTQTGIPPGTAHEDVPMDPVFQNFRELLRNIIGGDRPGDSPSDDRPQPGNQTQQPQPGGPGVAGLPPGFPFGPPIGGEAFPPMMGAHITYTSPSPLFPRDANTAQPQAHPVQDLPAMLRFLVDDINGGGGMMPPGGDHNQPSPVAPLLNFFASLLGGPGGPNAHGDVVYSQEALDRVISQLMETHAGSNAPGPASESAIASLPRKKIDKSMLDDKGKAECTICMDEVSVGDEVMSLPCSHWFHEMCGTAWLKEHDTCPICRKGIMPESGTNRTGSTSNSTSNSNSNTTNSTSSSTSRTPGEPSRNSEPWRLRRASSGLRHSNSIGIGGRSGGGGGGNGTDRARPTSSPRSRSDMFSNYPGGGGSSGTTPSTNNINNNNNNMLGSRLFPSSVRGPALPFYQSRFTSSSSTPPPSTPGASAGASAGHGQGQQRPTRNDGPSGAGIGGGGGFTERIRGWWDSVGGSNNSNNNNTNNSDGGGSGGGGDSGGGGASG